jgi:hypothetical protein
VRNLFEDTKVPHHFGVGFTFLPQPEFTPARFLEFQQQLARRGLNFSNTVFGIHQCQLLEQSTHLAVVLTAIPPSTGQLAVVCSLPVQISIDDFASESESVLDAFRDVWVAPLQAITRDCTLRYTLAAPAAHAFQYLWEERLHQKDSAIQLFGRPILGGGLRFVLPGLGDDPKTQNIEVKIESLLADPSKLFVETQAIWPRPLAAGEPFEVGLLLSTVAEYIKGPVMNFLQAEPQ